MHARPAEQPIDILLVEDNPGDIRLIQESLRLVNTANRLHMARDGEAAIRFLERGAGFDDLPRPDIVLLDLNLPKVSGTEVLKRIKSDSSLCSIPVIILTSSDDPEDISRSYRHHANCYVRKPMEISVFDEVMQKIDDFWFSIACLPES